MTGPQRLATLARRALPALCPPLTLENLPGGALNHVYRLVDARGKTVVLKQSPPRAARAQQIALDPRRLRFEAEAMAALAPGGVLAPVSDDAARAPRLLARVDRAHLLLLEDLGSCPDLAAQFTAGGLLDGRLAAVGAFIGRLHRLSAERPELAARFDNADVQQTRHRVQYQGVHGFCQRAGLDDPAALGARAEALGQRLLRPGRCLIMGDLWPRSVLVGDRRLFVIDWEFCHWGNPLQDLAHMASHLWILSQAHDPDNARGEHGQGRIDHFLSSYLDALGPARDRLLDARLAIDCAIHFGAELLMRLVGPFRQGTPYEGLRADHPRVRQALSAAARHLAAPERVPTFARLAT